MAYVPDPREFGSLGFHLTLAERLELQTRMMMQAQGRELWAYASGLPDYAGMRLDHAAGGRLVFGFTDGVETHRRELLRRASHPARLDVVLAPVSREDLEAQRRRIELDRERLAAQGIRLWHTRTDWQTSRVVAGIEDPSAAAQAALRAAYGDNVDVEAGAAPEPHHTGHGSYDARRDEYDPPVRGGIRLKFDNWYRTGYCSSAFVAYRRGTYPDYYVLSAGHCAGGYEGSGQGRVLWGGRRLNHVTSNSFEDGSYSDSAIVPIRSAVRSRWVYVQPDWRAWQIHSSIPAMSEQVGHVTCMAGVYNPGTLRAQNCGTIIDNNYNFFETEYGHWAAALRADGRLGIPLPRR
jgi:hypothetical protein